MLSRKPWKPEAVFFLFGGVFFCLFAGTLIASSLFAKSIGHGTTIGPMTVALLSFQGAALLLTPFFVKYHHVSLRDAFGLANHWGKSLGLGAVAVVVFLPIGFVLQFLSAYLMEQLARTPAPQEVVVALREVHSLPEQIIMFILAVIVAPVAEEILFRGILYPTIKQAGFPRIAFWGVSLLFAASHVTLVIFLPLFALALMLTILYERTDNLLCPITAHCLFNAFNFTLLFLVKGVA
jgi:membrane protease YdiL (CAAX protease family)